MNGKRMVRSGSAIGVTIGLLIFAPLVAGAEVTLTWYTADGGGWTFSSGGDYTLGGTAGQPDAGVSSQGNLELFGGFWRGGKEFHRQSTSLRSILLRWSPSN